VQAAVTVVNNAQSIVTDTVTNVGASVGMKGAVAAAAAAAINNPGQGVALGDISGAEHLITPRMSTISKIMVFDAWAKPDFLIMFFSAAFMGSVLNYSIFLCTTVNSALTTAVVGCLKNVLTTYIGMMIFSDYVFEWYNFIGLNVSIAGSLYYTYVTIFKGIQGFGQ
jgi:hypothetical protein